MSSKQKVLIVDDSPFVRRMLADWVSKEPDLELVGQACDGKEGWEMAKSLKPDVITLDVEMPVMNGIESLQNIKRDCPKTAVLMVSSVTTKGADLTLRALELGAYDFVTKPGGSSSLKFVTSQTEVVEKIRHARYVTTQSAITPTVIKLAAPKILTDKIVVIASSTGGPAALNALWKGLPEGLQVPILIVQHMPEGFTASLANRLNGLGTVPCREATVGDEIKPGQALVAPGGKHMLLTKEGRIAFNTDPTLHGVRPAADYLFKSAAEFFGTKVVGVVLTGMGRDGAEGAKTLRDKGCTVFGEAESTATIYGMPKAAKEVGGITAEYPIHEMAAAIVASLTGKAKHAA